MRSPYLRFSIFLACLVLLMFPSCKRSYAGSYSAEEREFPDMVMYGATYIFGEMDRKPLTMNAEKITVYTGENGRTILEKASFSQDDELEGSCDLGEINSDNTLAKLSGNVHLVKKSDDFIIECDELEWDDGKQIISTTSEVYVSYGDGTELRAIGFSAQLNDNIYEFGRIVEGRFSDGK